MSLIICGVVVLLLAGFIFVVKKKGEKKVQEINKELNFFKKEREYYDEALLMLST